MDERLGLLLDRRDDLAVAVAEAVHRDAGGEVEPLAAVRVPELRPLALHEHDVAVVDAAAARSSSSRSPPCRPARPAVIVLSSRSDAPATIRVPGNPPRSRALPAITTSGMPGRGGVEGHADLERHPAGDRAVVDARAASPPALSVATARSADAHAVDVGEVDERRRPDRPRDPERGLVGVHVDALAERRRSRPARRPAGSPPPTARGSAPCRRAPATPTRPRSGSSRARMRPPSRPEMPDRRHAGRGEAGGERLVDEAREHHLDDVHRLGRGLAPAVDEARLDAERLQQPVDRAAAAVDEDGVAAAPPDLLGERRHEAGVLERGPADLVDAHAHDAAPVSNAEARPSVSGQPIARFRFWMAWPAAPFTRLSIAEKTTARPRAAAWTEMRQSFVWTTSDSRGGAPSTTWTKALPS